MRLITGKARQEYGEALTLKVIAMRVSNSSLKHRTLGKTAWNTISLTHVERSVYEVTIPAQTEDYEYYIESGSVKHPASANNTFPTYNTVIVIRLNIEVLGIEKQEIQETSQVYPNPTNGLVSIVLGDKITKNARVKIIDLSGSIVLNKKFKDVKGQ